jgi:hypothetical protein
MAQTKQGNTSINMKYSEVNNAWLVWREDSGHQALVRIFNDQKEAREDYVSRVSFFLKVAMI